MGFAISSQDKMGGIGAQGEKSLMGTVVGTASSAAQCVDLLLGRREPSCPLCFYFFQRGEKKWAGEDAEGSWEPNSKRAAGALN